jgi:hypothetical protein
VFALGTWLFAQPPISFQPATRYNFGTEDFRHEFAVADLNRDGRADLIATQPAGLVVFYNRGDGTLPPPVVYSKPGFESWSIATSDFNQDGWPDVAIAVDANLAVYINRGDGTLATPATYPHGFAYSRGGEVCAADFNRDSYPDLAVVYHYDSVPALRIFQNSRNGTFVQSVSASSGIGSVSCADIDGDRFPDFVTHGGGFANWSVDAYINRRNMTFEARAYKFPSAGPFVLADFTGDKFPDFIGANIDTGFGPLIYLINGGSGTFGSRQDARIPAWSPPYDLEAGDFDLDGDLDLASASFRVIHVGTNKGGTFDPPISIRLSETVEYFANSMAVLDLNDDGQFDIVAAANNRSNGPYDLFVLINKTHPSVRIRQPSLVPNRGGNGGTVTASISIPGLAPGSTIRLTKAGQADIVASRSTITSYYGTSILTASFDLRHRELGVYDVVVITPDKKTVLTLVGGFVIEQGGISELWVDIVGRAVIRAGREQKYLLVIGNRGKVDADFGNFWISFPSVLTWSVTGESPPNVAFTLGDNTIISFDVFAIPAASIRSSLLTLKAPDDPKYGHTIMHVNTWVSEP